MTKCACLEMNFRRSAKRCAQPYNVKTCLVALSLLREYKIQLFAYFLQSLVLIIDCFVFDSSGFPVITSSQPFTNSESKWARNPVVTVCLKVKFGGRRWRTLSRLRIHERRSRSRRSYLNWEGNSELCFCKTLDSKIKQLVFSFWRD